MSIDATDDSASVTVFKFNIGIVHRSGDTSNGMSNVWATCNGHIDASSNHRSVMLRLNQMIDDRAVIMAVPESEQIELELL